MVNSMTAFSKNKTIYEWGYISWEIQSLNQRYLEIYTNLPKKFFDLSWIIRKKIKNNLSRGKIECNLNIDINHNQSETLIINKKLINNLINSAQWIKSQINSGEIDLIKILYWPGVISYKQNNINHINDDILNCFETALNQLICNRKKEGLSLKECITNRLNYIHIKINKIQQYLPEILNQKRTKLSEYIRHFCSSINSTRIEQELLLIIQKIDISEEIDRLTIHIQEMHNVLAQNKPIGRQLDFITQELQRETNTLTSKSIDAHLTQIAISIKILIEQIREQIQNIE